MRLDLRPQTEHETTLRDRLQVPTDMGEDHRVACEPDRDRRVEVDSFRSLGGKQKWEERVVVAFVGERAGIAAGFEAPRLGFGGIERIERGIDLHSERFLSGSVEPAGSDRT